MSDHHVFAADWLSLREPADHIARSDALFEELARSLARRPGRQRLRIVDLGAGTGSNLRWLAPRLQWDQCWTLVDRDTELLARAQLPSVSAMGGFELSVSTLEADLSGSRLPWIAAADLVTAAALLDLVSAEWIEHLSAACAAAGAAALFVLTVDGRWGFLNQEGAAVTAQDDGYVQTLFNQHQRRDKGLGAALGPEAGPRLAECLSAHGMSVNTQVSDWQLAAGDPLTLALGRRLMAGWRDAALEQAPEERARIEDWHQARQAELSGGRLGLQVGHVDVLGLPPQ